MDKQLLEYIKNLVPENLPDGKELVKEGYEMGKDITPIKGPFLEKYGYDSYLDYRKDLCRQGKINWQFLLGLATMEEQLDAIKEVDKFCERTGINARTVQAIPSSLVALPVEYWDKAPKPTSYIMQGEEDWIKEATVAPVQAVYADWHVSTPNALETTKYAIKAGTPIIGTFSQLIWDLPGFDDDVKRFSDMVRSIGMVASKRDNYLCVNTYPEDGIPGYFLDIASYVGYQLFEHYIVDTLCGARLSVCYGGLLTEIKPRMAFGLAIHKLLGTDDEPILSYINGGTIDQWDHDINANFGTSCQEMLFEIMVELKYKMHMSINPVSVTEKLRVPTLQELFDIVSAGARVEEKAKEWMEFVDFTPLEEMAEGMVEKGTEFFHNILDTVKAAGLDIEDPLQMIMLLKNFNPVKFEQAFHPSIKEKGKFEPYYPSVMGRQTMEECDRIIEDIKDKGYGAFLKDRKAIVVSADGHSYGLMAAETILTSVGCDLVNGGVDYDAAEVLDLADEEGTNLIFISIHCGQALDYGRQLTALAKERGKDYIICMGGVLNSILPGHSEPTDVSDMLRDMGIIAENKFEATFENIKKLEK